MQNFFRRALIAATLGGAPWAWPRPRPSRWASSARSPGLLPTTAACSRRAQRLMWRANPWFWYVQRIGVGAALAIAFAVGAIRALGAEERSACG